ncbi:MAG: dTMP kinase [Nanoarchaeota archaeon]|nr:dTMP kinase [Nanoarchaeota archaeon]
MKNLFITFEGIDGAGKDTQLHKLAEYIRDDDWKVLGDKYAHLWIIREPSLLTEPGRQIASLIRQRDVSAKEAADLYIADRKEHTKLIKETLKHSFVLCSRYDLSTLSYQMTQGMEFEELYTMHDFDKEEGCLKPDLTIVFELPVEIALQRTAKRNSQKECFEKEDFQKTLAEKQQYCIQKLQKKGRTTIVVNANQSMEEVTKEMLNKIKEIFPTGT